MTKCNFTFLSQPMKHLYLKKHKETKKKYNETSLLECSH